MRVVSLFIFISFYANALKAQISSSSTVSVLDSIAKNIPEIACKNVQDLGKYINTNFSSEDEKVRAIYLWITTHIDYDVNNLFIAKPNEKRIDKITKTLKTRKVVCEHYALLFNELCNKCNIPSYIIEGLTKQNGLNEYLAHAWSAAYINQQWWLYDATWGAGYVRDGKYYRKQNEKFYKVSPETFIETHMPFDYLWQFLHYPISYKEFYELQTTQNISRPYYNFNDAIALYEKQNRAEQLEGIIYRISKQPVQNGLIFNRLTYFKREAQYIVSNKAGDHYNEAVALYNTAIKYSNAFIAYRNKQFNTIKTDEAIQQLLDKAVNKLNEAKDLLEKYEMPDEQLRKLKTQLAKTMLKQKANLDEQQSWLTQYFSKDKSARKAMFYLKKVKK